MKSGEGKKQKNKNKNENEKSSKSENDVKRINCMGNMVNTFTSLVINITMKNITGIQDDIILKELFAELLSNQSQEVYTFSQKYQNMNITQWEMDFKEYTNNSNENLQFKTMDSISHELYKNISIFIILGVAAFINCFFYCVFFNISSTRQTTRIRSLTFNSLMRQSIYWHEKISPGEICSSIISDTIIIEDGIGMKVGIVLQYFVGFIVCYVLAFMNSWKLTLNMIIILPAMIIVVVIMSIILSFYTKKRQEDYAILGGIAQEAFAQIRTIVSFGNERKEIERYVNKLTPTYKYGVIMSQISGIGTGWGSKYVYDGEMQSGDVLKVIMAVILGSGMLTTCSNLLTSFSHAAGAASKLFNIIDRMPNDAKDKKESIENTNTPIRGTVEFRDVHFSYPSRPDVEVLKGISFKCNPNQTVAIVGASGSGKSTIVQLLERYYTLNDQEEEDCRKEELTLHNEKENEIEKTDSNENYSDSTSPHINKCKNSGEILIDGKRIEDYDVHWLRSHIGLVSQEPTLFDTTIAENISMAFCGTKDMDTFPEEKIEEAAKQANAYAFIKKLPNGYATNAGEGGVQLSGGQKQRICIARALVNQPSIFLLDEATSALDNQSEKIVQKSLDQASTGRTTIIIAHRLSTIRNADIILIMDKRLIVESGTHHELMSQKNIYYNLIKNQEISAGIDETTEEDDTSSDDNIINSNDGGEMTEGAIISDSNSVVSLDRRSTTMSKVFSTISALSNSTSLGHHQSLLFVGSINHGNNNVINLDVNSKFHHRHSIIFMDWKRFFSYNKPVWWANVIGIFGSIINGTIQPFYAFLLSSALDAFNKQGDELLKVGKFWALVFVGFSILNFFSYYFQIGGYSISGEYLSCTFRKLMYESIIQQEVGFFDTNEINQNKKSKKSKKMIKRSKKNDLSKDAKDGNKDAITSDSTGDDVVQRVHTLDKKPDNSDNDNGSSNGSTGTLTAKLSTETTMVQGLNNNIGFIFEIFVILASAFIISFLNSWKLTLILFVMVPFLFLGVLFDLKAGQDKNEKKRRLFENSTKIAVEAITNVKTVYALNLENHFCRLYDAELVKPEKELEKKYYLSALGVGFSGAILFFVMALGFYIGFVFIRNGEIQFKNMFSVLMAITLSSSAVGTACSVVPDYSKAVEAFNHVIDIIDRKPKINASSLKGYKPKQLYGNITLDRLRFRYPSRPNVTVLRMGNNKVELPEGKMLAIVGGSGCGKSTIIGLIERWYDAQHGEISMDGILNKKYNIKWLRQQIGIVNQEPNLFNISIKDNIMYGKEDATEEEIMCAARKSNIHDFIMSLPEGYNTMVGGMGTSKMSGGQKQRIAIARALIRDPKILLLDEATSALDAESEYIIQSALEKASEGRTTITITHRLSTIRHADIIMVMKDGRIIEKGNHEELMSKKGEYYEMVLAGDGVGVGNSNK
ncbi:hypothetical protein PIROE2DRAFT_1740 [Piromyces sp. E2]|nr:hypothetical protein PIROE2DRAFT_1740 [Piromyces sp. E2]|eukprot:OUM70066.1 hypothetical protein PIROE2DRAFT_1740 [Piromyces sp. E2]